MGGGKETPRQKMVGLMYLVLMALLAMNVSKDVLNSFIIINDGLAATNKNFEAKNETTYSLFEKANANDAKKVGPWLAKANQVKEKTQALIAHIEQLKKEVMAFTDGKPADQMSDSLIYVEQKDNYDKPTEFLIGSEVSSPKTGPNTAAELKDKIDAYRAELMEILGEKEKNILENSLRTDIEIEDNGVKETWISLNFYHLPLVATVTSLTRIQSDIRNAEADVIKTLYKNIDAGDFKFDTLAVKVIPNTNYVFLGDSFSAEVLVAAMSTTVNPKLEVGNVDTVAMTVSNNQEQNIKVGGGMARYRTTPTSEGRVEWGGIISIQKPDGTYQPFPFKHEYMVAKPQLVVSPTAMNVFYKGIENPIEVSAPGVSAEDLQVNVSGCKMSGSKGKYTLIPEMGGTEAVVTVSAKMGSTTKRIGEAKFRLKSVPDPKPKIGKVVGSEGKMDASTLAIQQGIQAELENFVFDLKYTVVSFKISTLVKGSLVYSESKSNRFTEEQAGLLKTLKRGSKLFIEDIRAKGPDGSVRELGSMIITVI